LKGLGRVFADIDISLDGFIAGEGASSNEPLGKGGDKLIWYGDDINDENANLFNAYEKADAVVLEESAAREGAVIMGRNTFEVSVDEWGEDPPIHKPCFVLTHKPTKNILKKGGTTFTFVSDLNDAVNQALRAAEGRDVGVMGGGDTIRQVLSAGLLDELHLHLVPVFLGSGIRLFDGENLLSFGLRKISIRDGRKATHLLYQVIKK
jgi:dihydrofolate reductase